MASLQPLRAGKRLAAVLGAAALSVGAFALPAAAQTPAPVETDYAFTGPLYQGDQGLQGGFSLVFGDDFSPGEHAVSVAMTVDAPAGAFQFTTDDVGDGALPCTSDGDGTRVDCVREDAESALRFAFGYGAAEDAPPGVYDYAITVKVDGETVDTAAGSVEILHFATGTLYPYLHANLDYTEVAPGSAVEVFPEVYQDMALAEGTEAVVMTFTEPEYAEHDQAVDAIAAYDNCSDDVYEWPGVVCVFTEFEDAPGTVFTTTEPVSYQVDAGTPGPFDVCVCYYSAFTADAERLADEFGIIDWDPGSDNLIGLRAVADPENEYSDSTNGELGIETTKHFYDLSIGGAKTKGDKGDEVTVTVPVANGGPANAIGLFGRGSYYVTGVLPDGLELIRAEDGVGQSDDWYCLSEADFADYLPHIDPDSVDFACLFTRLDADATLDFSFTVAITDPASKDTGRLEVHGFNNLGVYPGVLEDQLENNVSAITVNGNGSGKLPETGTALGSLVIGAAALVVAAGAILLVLTARRRPAATD